MTLAEMRKKKKLTMAEASRRIGITETYLYYLENGKRKPSDKLKFQIAKVYGVSPTTIFLNVNLTKS